MKIPQQDIFDQTNDRALAAYPGLLQEWIPGGKVVGHEYKALNPTRADQTIGSFSINVHNGKWLDGATGDEGGDPISLYAYLKFGGVKNRVQACKELSAKFGLDDTAPKARPHLRVVKPEPKDEWKPQVPPPDGASEPTAIFAKYDHVFRYVDPHGHLLRYVVRKEKTALEGKQIRAVTYGYLKDKNHPHGETGWHIKQPDRPRALYGLDRLDGRDVLLQEGELKTDLAALNLPQYACLSLTGGSAGAEYNDLEPLRGRRVIICPDQDFAGRKAATQVAALLVALGCTVTLIDMTGQPDKWDLGDAVKEGWNGERLEEFLKARSVPSFENPDADPEGDLDFGEPSDDGSEWDKDPEEHATDTEGVIPLGHDQGIFYYLSRGTGQVHGLTPARHVELELMALADPVSYWQQMPMFRKEDGVNYKKAAAWMMQWCKRVGIYKPDRIRGRGAWMDQDRPILHLGESMLVGGVAQRSLMLPGSYFVYAKARSLGQGIAEPTRNGDAHKLLKMCELLRWEKPISATLAAGWIAVAPICGALQWRPSVWVTGGSNSGKTTFLQNIIAPIMGRGLDDGIALNTQSKTTEAGLRQMLNSDARPVIFDEAEAEMLTDKARMQSVIDLVRQSSSEGGAEIIKGTQTQAGAKRYRIRSVFLFSSINVSLDHMADESRITVLDLYNPGPGELAEDRARWLALCGMMRETVEQPDWCAGMVARSVALMHVIRANAQTFKLAVLERMGNGRAGDQLGALLAGAFSLTSTSEITLEEARAYLERPENDFSSATAIDAPKDEMRLISRLMQQSIKFDIGGKFLERNISDMIGIARGDDGEAMAAFANADLKRYGVKLDGDGVWISNTHTAIKEWLKDTPWSTGWGRALKRLPGAKSSDKQNIAFGKFDKTKAVWVPLKALEG
jgi:putative DNA primase/helicase